VKEAAGDWAKLVAGLNAYDAAVAAQAAHLSGIQASIPDELSVHLQSGSAATRAGFRTYAAARRDSGIARSRTGEPR
jgi:hypothetical protein